MLPIAPDAIRIVAYAAFEKRAAGTGGLHALALCCVRVLLAWRGRATMRLEGLSYSRST